MWYVVAATNAAASAYKWLRETIFDQSRGVPCETYAQMDVAASGVRPGSEGMLFLPFLAGERSPYWDSELRAAFLGVSAAHHRRHFCRAVLEGVAFSLRECRDLLGSLGVVVPRPYFTGGGVESHLWRTILASVLRTPGMLALSQGPASGAAMLAAASVRGTMPVITRETVTIEPDAGWVDIYDRLYRIYGDAVRHLGDIDHALVRESQR
jgi:xylulokinase